jgi:molecular chaperone GrpE
VTSHRHDEVVENDTETPEEPVGVESPGSSSDLDGRLAHAEAKRDEYLADLQRVQADYENYRKRATRDQERLVTHAHERLVRELLPVLDDLERAVKPPVRASGPREGVRGNRVEVPPTEFDALQSEYDALVEGVRLVERSLRSALEKEGLVEIEASGAFDPHVHEALLSQPRDGAEPGSVVEVLQRGYRIGDRVIRPARVIVAE